MTYDRRCVQAATCERQLLRSYSLCRRSWTHSSQRPHCTRYVCMVLMRSSLRKISWRVSGSSAAAAAIFFADDLEPEAPVVLGLACVNLINGCQYAVDPLRAYMNVLFATKTSFSMTRPVRLNISDILIKLDPALAAFT